MERVAKYIVFPIEVWEDTRLSWNEKILLMEIDSFTSKSRPCVMSNEYIAGIFKVSEVTASKYISHLISEGYVSLVSFNGRVREVCSNLDPDFKADLKQTLRQTQSELKETNISLLNKKEDIYKYISKKESGQESLFHEETPQAPKGDFSFVDLPQLLPAFNEWLAYKKERKESYKSGRSLRACYNELKKLSGGDPKVAMEDVVQFSIGRNYMGMVLRREGNATKSLQSDRVQDVNTRFDYDKLPDL